MIRFHEQLRVFYLIVDWSQPNHQVFVMESARRLRQAYLNNSHSEVSPMLRSVQTVNRLGVKTIKLATPTA